jgi:hypothetical protein
MMAKEAPTELNVIGGCISYKPVATLWPGYAARYFLAPSYFSPFPVAAQ